MLIGLFSLICGGMDFQGFLRVVVFTSVFFFVVVEQDNFYKLKCAHLSNWSIWAVSFSVFGINGCSWIGRVQIIGSDGIE